MQHVYGRWSPRMWHNGKPKKLGPLKAKSKSNIELMDFQATEILKFRTSSVLGWSRNTSIAWIPCGAVLLSRLPKQQSCCRDTELMAGAEKLLEFVLGANKPRHGMMATVGLIVMAWWWWWRLICGSSLTMNRNASGQTIALPRASWGTSWTIPAMTSSRRWSTTGRLLSSEGVRQILWSFCWDPPVVSCCFLCQDYKACILEESATVLMKFQNLWCKHVLNSRYGAGIRWSMSPPARATCTQPRRSYLLVDCGYPAANQMSTLARAAHDWQTKWLRKQTCSRFRNCLEFNSCFFPRRLDKEQLAQKWRNYKVKIVKYQTYLSSFRKKSKLYAFKYKKYLDFLCIGF